VANQIADRERHEGAIDIEIGPKQGARRADPGILDCAPEQPGGEMDDGDRVADERQRRANRLQRRRLVRNREMTGLTARGGAALRKMGGEPLLQRTRSHRRNQGRARRLPPGIDEETGTIWAGTCAGEGGGSRL
jgi:hypothetical protein